MYEIKNFGNCAHKFSKKQNFQNCSQVFKKIEKLKKSFWENFEKLEKFINM